MRICLDIADTLELTRTYVHRCFRSDYVSIRNVYDTSCLDDVAARSPTPRKKPPSTFLFLLYSVVKKQTNKKLVPVLRMERFEP